MIIMKAIFMVPFITFEYYLIVFEHIFVDSAHYMSSILQAVEKMEN